MGYTYDLKSCLTWVIHRNFFSGFLHAKHYWFVRRGLCQENIIVQLRYQSLFIARGAGGGGLGAKQGDIVIVRRRGLLCHFYGDDAQLYCSFKLHDQAASVQAIESCLNDIDA